MARLDLSRYLVEFVRNFGYGYKTYTWFVSRKNYGRNGFYNSDSVWVLTTDDKEIFNKLQCSNMSRQAVIRFIKKHPTTKFYNDPLW